MSNLINKLGIRGWNGIEDYILATLLTGDPLLLIGARGSAKTHAARLIAQALNKTFVAYDASKAMFDDVLGFPNINKMRDENVIDYIPSPLTIWNKEMVLIDELNRAVVELQSKWLEIIRSRQIMGFKTQVKWVWAAMNPTTYDGAIPLDAALEGRFSLFVRPPDMSDMDDDDRKSIIMNVTSDDMPAFDSWGLSSAPANSIAMIKALEDEVASVGKELEVLLRRAAACYRDVASKFDKLPDFLSKFLKVAHDESKGSLHIDGRRAGFIYRAIIATRAIQYAKRDIYKKELPDLQDTVINVLKMSLNGSDDELSTERENVVLSTFNVFGGYFADNIKSAETAYNILTENDVLVRMLKLVTEKNVNETLRMKVWKDIIEMDDSDVCGYAMIALYLESCNKGKFVPPEIMSKVAEKTNLPVRNEFTGPDEDYVVAIQKVVDATKGNSAKTAIVLHSVNDRMNKGPLDDKAVEEIRKVSDARIAVMEELKAAIEALK